MNRRAFSQVLAASSMGTLASVPSMSANSATQAVAPATPFPLSVMLWTVFNNLPFEERLSKVAEAGYRNVELDGEYSSWTDADFVRANAARRRLGINFDAMGELEHGIVDPSVRNAFLNDLQTALEVMEKLECPAMIVLAGDVVTGLSHESQHQSCIESLKRAAALIEGKEINGQPVRLLLECIDSEENPHYFLQSAAEAIDVVRAVNHPQVQFLYDIFHEQIAEGNLIEKLENNIDIIGLIHIADVPGRHEPGTGEINYANIYRKLAVLHYSHIVTMEFRPTGDHVASLRAAREMVARALSA